MERACAAQPDAHGHRRQLLVAVGLGGLGRTEGLAEEAAGGAAVLALVILVHAAVQAGRHRLFHEEPPMRGCIYSRLQNVHVG